MGITCSEMKKMYEDYGYCCNNSAHACYLTRCLDPFDLMSLIAFSCYLADK